MAEEKSKSESRFSWKDAIDLLKDGVEFAEKIVGGRNALVAGATGIAIGFAIGALTVSPSDSKCADYFKEQAAKENEALMKFLKSPVHKGVW